MAVRARPDNLSLEEVSARPAPGDGARWFAELWEHQQELQAVCLRMVGDPGKAEDLVQETYLRALQQSRRLDRRDSFGPWLATVARRRAIDELRARRRNREQPAVVDLRATAGGDDPVEQVLQQELFERIQVALRELTTRERQLLLRQVTHGLTLAELAEEEDTSIASVRSVLSRARGKLRTALERGGPLGVGPAPRVLSGLRERLQRVAARVEGAMPSLAAGGAHLGDMVGAVLAAAVMLFGGTTVPAPIEDQVEVRGAVPAAFETASAAGRVPGTTSDGPGIGQEPAPVGAAGPTPEPLPPPLDPLPPGIDTPWLPHDGADQPEDAVIHQFVASADGSVLFATGMSSKGDNDVIYRSRDGGRTWQRVQAKNFTTGSLLIPSTYPTLPTLFALDMTGLWRSDDHGEEFHFATVARGAAAVSPHFDRGDRRVFVSLVLGKLGTYDADTHLTTVPAGQPDSGAISTFAFTPSYPDGQSVVVGGRVQPPLSHFVSAVSRCGESSCSAPTLLHGSQMAPLLTSSRTRPGRVFAATVNGLFQSDDEARTFVRVPLPPDLALTNMAEGAAGELFAFGISMPPKTAASGLFRSSDGGATWTPLATGTPLQRGVSAVTSLANGNLLAGGSSGIRGVWCSADDGATWARRCP